MTDRTRAERCLAALIHEIREDWDEHGILVVLRKVSDKPLADVTAAALYCAHHRPTLFSPAPIALDGEHWSALNRMAGKPDPAPVPGYLRQPSQPIPAEQNPATPEQIRAARAKYRTEGSTQ